MPYETLFFDLDGTLIDSRERLHTLFCDLISDSELGFDEYWADKYAKRTNHWILKNKFHYSDEMIQSFQRNWMRRIESNHYLAMDVLFADTLQCLERLSGDSDMFVITARQSYRKAHEQLEALGIAHFFKKILVTGQKQTKEELIASLGLCLTRDNSAIIGDTGEETLTGKSLGITTISTLTGFRAYDVLAAYQPDFIIDNLSSLFQHQGVLGLA